MVLQKIENAFEPGDPVLELAGRNRGPGSEAHWIMRDEQPLINAIIDGTDRGHYFLLIGEKGTGKSSMILEAMQRIDANGVAMFDAHADIEIFRIRLGRALDFEVPALVSVLISHTPPKLILPFTVSRRQHWVPLLHSWPSRCLCSARYRARVQQVRESRAQTSRCWRSASHHDH